MDTQPFLERVIATTNPKIPFRFALLNEGSYLLEVDRLEMQKSSARQKKQDETETKEIINAIDREKHDTFVAKKRQQQLMRSAIELRHMQRYLATAETSQGLIAQLKREDAEIDRSFEQAIVQAQDIRAEYRATEERQKAKEAAEKAKAIELCMVLKEQMAEHDAKRQEIWEERVRDGIEIEERLKKLDEQDERDRQAAAIAKIQLRKEIVENLRVREEQRQIDNKPRKCDLLYYYEVDDERIAFKKQQQDKKDFRLKCQQDRAEKLGNNVLKKRIEDRQTITNFIEYWYNEQQSRNNLQYQQEEDKENENRRILQENMRAQALQRETEKQEELRSTMELSRKRVMQTHDTSEIRKMRKRMESERWENDMFIKVIKEEREERKAEEVGRATKPGGIDWEAELKQREIEATRIKVLNEQPIPFLRYLPSTVVSSEYLPQPLREAVKEQVRRDPIPMFNQKRNKPHLKRAKPQGGDLIKCCKACPPPKPLSDIF